MISSLSLHDAHGDSLAPPSCREKMPDYMALTVGTSLGPHLWLQNGVHKLDLIICLDPSAPE